MLTPQIPRVLKYLLLGLLASYFALLIIQIWNSEKLQWDFYMYYHSAKAYAQGVNPYDTEALSQIAQLPPGLNFVYPPITLPIMRVFLALDYRSASHLFLLMKCILALGLLFLWTRVFLKEQFDPLFALFCLIGFNGALCIDLISGNISLVEQFLIWSGFYFFLRRKLFLFCGLILLAALFKVTPLFFLVLLWFAEGRKKYAYFASSLLLYSIIMIATYLTAPDLFMGFLHNSTSISEKRMHNPSTFSLINEFTGLLGGIVKMSLPGPAAIIASIVAGTAVLLLSLWERYSADKRDIFAIFLTCVVYALILPRFKEYSYVLLLLPAYFIILRIGKANAFGPLFVFFILSSIRSVNLPFIDPVFKIFWEHYPAILVFVTWGLYLYHIRWQLKQ